MPRPHGLPRWVLLALACAALLAVAMIPRGVVRTIEASQLPEPAVAAGERFETPSQHQLELPGVRATVSREERYLPSVPAALDATAPGEAAVHEVEGEPTPAGDDAPPTRPLFDAEPHSSRAPPPSI